jgi:hypothetical protein
MSTNKTLNDLFRAARSGRDAEPEIVSQNDAADLIRSNSLRSVPQSSSIGHRLHDQLLSTPLRIGMTAMTAASLVTIGALLLSNLFSPLPTPVAPIQTLELHTKASLPRAQPEVISPLPVQSKSVAQAIVTPSAHATEVSTPVSRADSLQPYDIPVEKLAELGITLEDNGDIDFYTKSKDGPINRFGLPPTWGLRLHMGEELSAKDVAGLQIPKSAPRLVTMPNGAKRMFSFEVDTTFTKIGDGEKTVLRLHSIHQIAPLQGDIPFPSDSMKKYVNDRVELSVFGDSLRNAQITMEVDASTKSTMNRLKVDADDTSGGQMETEFANGGFGKGFPDFFSVMDSLAPRGDSVDAEDFAEFNHIFGDSVVRNWAKDRRIQIEKHFKILTVPQEAKGYKFGNDKIDTTLKMMGVDPSVIKGIVKLMARHQGFANADSIIHSALQSVDSEFHAGGIPMPMPGKFKINEHLIDDIRKPINLDKLIPIRVRNLKNPEHPNELIFWYEPTPELTSMLPRNRVASTLPQHITTSVFPNPTTGPATVHYELKDSPNARFTVRNLLGQQVLDAGSTSEQSGDQRLDLSSLEAGVYLLVTTTESGEESVERIVVAK